MSVPIKDDQVSNLSIDDITNKEFSIELKGYNVREVNAFLDIVINDYHIMNELNHSLKMQLATAEKYNRELRERLNQLTHENNTIMDHTQNIQSGNYGNLDLIKRLSKLEEIVFSHTKPIPKK
ncbi:hypothetical protein ASO20_00545 [Mycoplasma sp. (ex Biomphalaria glabrata)]|uniref:DivIVA domain-containing protein n=1 Tax=Mycoplasma sp. (ex Biomphalaria glabrata) TaxID=1749074 RepID=UPI00073A964E|nr:DivIVA domain-containing protein [Mycoplasma sp. (ex Biomphalaria glabrata)]ALV23165.1 hypothetical protein ASO20_00545 [Mycoplasma sp. (ex Biomphalaria glabrata)]